MVNYSLRNADENDFMLSFEIRKNALGEYVSQTWGWDEDWQLKYHKQDFNTDILKIIEVNGKPAGSLEVCTENDHIVVSGLYIIDKYQNLQIGSRIMSSIIEEASLIPANVKLQVLKVNRKAKAFYERIGFKVYNENEQHFQMMYYFSDK